jgi:hypothetical protein
MPVKPKKHAISRLASVSYFEFGSVTLMAPSSGIRGIATGMAYPYLLAGYYCLINFAFQGLKTSDNRF